MPPSTQPPNPNYDFIMQNGQPAKNGPKIPSLGLPKLAVRLIGGFLVLAIVIVIFSLVSSKGGGSGQVYVDALARGQEIIRVSTSVGTLAQDSPTQNLATTVQSSLASDQSQISTYLAGQKIKVLPASLAVDQDSTTDTEMQAASTNGNLNSIYASYLKSQLTLYQKDLKAAYNIAGPNGKAILASSYNSALVVLQSSQVASAN